MSSVLFLDRDGVFAEVRVKGLPNYRVPTRVQYVITYYFLGRGASREIGRKTAGCVGIYDYHSWDAVPTKFGHCRTS